MDLTVHAGRTGRTMYCVVTFVLSQHHTSEPNKQDRRLHKLVSICALFKCPLHIFKALAFHCIQVDEVPSLFLMENLRFTSKCNTVLLLILGNYNSHVSRVVFLLCTQSSFVAPIFYT